LIKVVGASDVNIPSDLHFSAFRDSFDAEDYDWNLLAQLRGLAYASSSRDNFDVPPLQAYENQVGGFPPGSEYGICFMPCGIYPITIYL